MKKLEKVLDKICNSIKSLKKEIRLLRIEYSLNHDLKSDEEMLLLFLMIMLLIFEFFGIILAIDCHNYCLLLMPTYGFVEIIVETDVKRIFFKKFNKYLLKTPKSTSLIFFVLIVTSFILSWKYFTAFIFSMVLAFMQADYLKTKKKM